MRNSKFCQKNSANSFHKIFKEYSSNQLETNALSDISVEG